MHTIMRFLLFQNTSNGLSDSSSMTVGQMLVYLFLLVLVLLGFGYWYYLHLQREMRNQLRSVLVEYVPLDGGDQQQQPIGHGEYERPSNSSSSRLFSSSESKVSIKSEYKSLLSMYTL